MMVFLMVNNHEQRRMDKNEKAFKVNVGILSSSNKLLWRNPLLSVALSLICDPMATSDLLNGTFRSQIAPVETKSEMGDQF